ncbi:BCCT family transporter [Sinobaca sp. H24]|uniref:BCCT family transporter n=1 Tax=Sinobaca sp. H24 TaxID=2923376 RepID=UPI00207A5324|nr:BCCT family transporter [Sinobaca sp. H24]
MSRFTTVLKVSIVLIISFLLFGVLFTEQLESGITVTQSFLFNHFGWYFQILVTGLLIFAVYLGFSKYGKIRLGKPDEKPEFSRLTWFTMLFSAGIGIGLLFYGVSEPISHFASPPIGDGGEASDAVTGVSSTWLHWGLHAWAIYALVALALALQQFRYEAPGLMSTTLRPVLGKHAYGPAATIVDIIAVFATLFGVAASLGLGSQQINSGLQAVFGVPYNLGVQFIIMAIITIIFVTSASTGIHRGIKYLSNINLSITGLFLLFMFIAGPTLFLLNMFASGLSDYMQNFIGWGLRMSPVDAQEADWTQAWTVFYWAWWISWTPFVGMFVARISRGRTIREFIAGVLLLPSIVSFFWFSTLGGSAIFMELYDGRDVSSQSLEGALFYVIEAYPMSGLISVLAIFVITIFFVTTADSATFVLGMQTTGGSLNPPTSIKIMWGVFFVTVTAVLLVVGGLNAFQTSIVVSALPLSIIIILMCIGIMKTLISEHKQN